MIAVFSDIHGNEEHLRAVLSEMHSVGAILCLGDLVGYRRHPQATVHLVRENCSATLLGNHDAAATGQLDAFLERLPFWLRRTLDDVEDLPSDLFQWLATRPPGGVWREMEIVHGTLRDPLMEFLEPGPAAESHFTLQRQRISLAGHTHRPLALSPEGAFLPRRGSPECDISSGRWALNPGSLGLRRGASWMELGTDYARWHFLD
jgi:predicted phosphodiesterase